MENRSGKAHQKGCNLANKGIAEDEAKSGNAKRDRLESERRALQVVEHLLDDCVSDEVLIDCAWLITPANYKDTVEERSITRHCGYPVCPNKVENVLKQRYKISTKANKVYDITERKYFCSNFCFKASKFFEVQISKTPLWLRKEERPPDIKLLKKGHGGIAGLELKLTDPPVRQADIEEPRPSDALENHSQSSTDSDSADDDEQEFVSSLVAKSTARVHWGETTQDLKYMEDKSEFDAMMSSMVNTAGCKALEDTSQLLSQCKVNVQSSECAQGSEQADCSHQTPDGCLNITQVCMSRRCGVELCRKMKGHGTLANNVRQDLLHNLKVTFTEWKTEETMMFLYGTDETISTLCTLPQYEEDLKINTIQKYKDRATERKEMELRLYCKSNRSAEEENQEEPSKDVKDLPLPPVDPVAQHVRKRIVVDKLNRCLKNIVGPLRISMSEITKDLYCLVRTFRFSSTNIVHKSNEWTLIAVVLLILLGEVLPFLKESLNSPSAVEYISSLIKMMHLSSQNFYSLILIFKPLRSIC
ncbi:putative RNA polymerase II subunit B1 CTD phosphatase rpap2 isoform X2 [Denticeps clupeoides]|uniref:putative RNA polymerase II subunit B1 CTD phosphatase rpap2 isoform X2 n=1 Tax=Denticeps clupeoides TaxID=299321 RepID=UPI0010A2B91D|nr:putative RNA polymerase II subunit B1 CTD phosphatase RPAP2 isoform X2 [Denticeps clupeoides]